MAIARMTAPHVGSEVGHLRRVMLHRPDLELRRLTPSNVDELLFDDVLWVKKARQEHDAFADTLRERGIDVVLLGDLLAETLKMSAAREWVLDRVVTELRYEGYVVRQQAEVRRHAASERTPIPAELDPEAIVGLRTEARETLRKFRPATLGQAGRLAGISPADVSLIAIALKRRREGGGGGGGGGSGGSGGGSGRSGGGSEAAGAAR